MYVKAVSVKFSIMSINRKYLFGLLAMIILLTMSLPVVTLSQEKAGKQNVLRQASLEWMQVGMKQYQSQQFADAEKSFRRALVFKKYLTEAERLKINNYLTKARIDLSEGKQPIESTKTADESVKQDQPDKVEEKVKSSEPLAAKEQQQTEKEPKVIKSQIEQKVQSVKTAEPEVSEIQIAEESPQDEIIIVKDNSFRSKFLRLSAWLSLNRRNVLLTGLPVLAVLVIIMKMQGLKRRPGRRVYANYAPSNSSFIGARLNGDGENTRSSSAAAARPKRKSFEQSTEHWNQRHLGPAQVAAKPSMASEKWPQRKDKSPAGKSVIAKAGQKQCRKCKEMKAHSDFHRDRSTKDGLARWCKECKKEYRQKRAAEKK